MGFAPWVNGTCSEVAVVGLWVEDVCLLGLQPDAPAGTLGTVEMWGGYILTNAASGVTTVVRYSVDFSGVATPLPVAAFSSAPTSTELSYAFDASSSSGQAPLSYSWAFGPGATATGPSPTHTFPASGNHDVTLTVTDAIGRTASVTHTVNVVGPLVVNSNADRPDSSPVGGICDTGQTVTKGGATVPECTLRAAIETANADPTAARRVTFDIDGAATPQIGLTSALPALSAPIDLDATTQPTTHQVQLRPAAGGPPDGLKVSAAGTSIHGFVLGGFTGTAIQLADAPDAVVAGNIIGLGPDGVTADPVGFGVLVRRGTGITVGGSAADANAISATGYGVYVGAVTATSPAIGITVSHNRIGTNATGTAAIGTGPDAGIFAAGTSSSLVDLTASSNVIHARAVGIEVAGPGLAGASLSQNRVGVPATDDQPLGSTGGIRVDGAPGVAVTGNRVLVSDAAEISIAGSIQLSLAPDGTIVPNSPLLPPGGGPVTGGTATVSGNTLGIQTPGGTPALNGVIVWAGADGVTVDDNRSSGHAGTEVDLKGGTGHTVTRNRLGALGLAGVTHSQSGISARETDNLRVGTAADDGNTIGGTSTAISVAGTSGHQITGLLVAGNTIGFTTDGSVADVSTRGIFVQHAKESVVGPGNVVASVGGPAVQIGSGVQGVTITGLTVGTDASAVTPRPVDVGIGVGSAGAPDADQPTGVVIGPDVRIVDAASSGITSYATDLAITGTTLGVLGDGQTLSGNHTGIRIARGATTVRATTVAGSAADGVTVAANATLDLRESTVRNNAGSGVSVDPSGKATIRTTRFITNGGEPIAGGGSPTAPVLSGAARIEVGTTTRTWLVVNAPSSTGTFEVFGNPSCAGDPEAEQVLFSTTVTKAGPQVITMLGRREVKGVRVAFTGADGKTSQFATCAPARLDLPDTDADGIPDVVEAAGPVPGAGQSAQVTVVPTDLGDWVTLSVATGSLRKVMPVDDPSPGTHPAGLNLHSGLFSFEVADIPAGSSVAVDMVLPQTDTSTSYWKYGPPALNASPRWFNWTFDAATGVGAERTHFDGPLGRFPGFTLHFTDGRFGDEDNLANGVIVDPGGPGTLTEPTASANPTAPSAQNTTTTSPATAAGATKVTPAFTG